MKIRNIELGDEPRICIPIVGTNLEALQSELTSLANIEYDLVEWRVDQFKQHEDLFALVEAAKQIREAIGEHGFLATLRTVDEGGDANVDEEGYIQLYRVLLESTEVDLIDIELYTFPDAVEVLVDLAHDNQCLALISSHDFAATPSVEEMYERLEAMKDADADIVKLAVMPEDEEDVADLMSITYRFHEENPQLPLISLAMGELGSITRVSGELFGSVITFGILDKPSAPGQLPSKQLKQLLEVVHQANQ